MDPANLLAPAIVYLELVAGATEPPPPQVGDDPTAVDALSELTKASQPRATQITDFTTCTKRFVRTSQAHAGVIDELVSS